MNTRLPLEERSISQIFLENTNTKYVIPIYQRNYAWGDVQIKALIEDVYDSWKKDSDRPYYIGTLVTYDRGNDVFEVIDGQQRLTTTYIILKVLIHEFGIKLNITSQLTYSARQLAANTLLSLGQKNHDKSVEEIATGYKIAKGAIEQKTFDDKSNNFNNFVNYLLHKVHIIHYKVPKDVDLNHYFEVMNSRGEQLESHEIVKSRFNNVLNDEERSVFNRIWEACSEMNLYIQQTFADKTVFGNKLDSFIIAEFADIDTLTDNEDSGKKSIQDLLLLQPTTTVEQIEEERNDKFQSIIDFPNFLLIVLKLTCIQEGIDVKVILDDKELLKHFDEVLTNKNDDEKKAIAKKFAYNLLKAKYLLDNFIVHHTADDEKELKNPWKLQYYYKENDRNKYTLSLAKDDKTQTELQHILSMLEVTFTPKQRKNYLLYCLLYLFDSNNMPLDIRLEENDAQNKMVDYLKFLQNLTEKYFYDVYLWGELNSSNQPQPDAFDTAILEENKFNWVRTTRDDNPKDRFKTIYEQGSANIPLYVFNYMDYILWKKYADNLKGKKLKKGDDDLDSFFKELGCSYFDLNFFYMFYFTRTRKSLEHFYPQANAIDEENNPDRLSHKAINCFGNFAMIGAEANSSGSNWSPRAKLDHYFPYINSDTNSDTTPSKINNVSVASIKFRIMAQMCNDNIGLKPTGQEWMRDEINAHQEAMLNILFPANKSADKA